MGECQLPRGGCIYDEEAGACAMCDEDGADVIGAFYANKGTQLMSEPDHDALIAEIGKAFPGCTISHEVGDDQSMEFRYLARITLPTKSWCASRGPSPLQALMAVFGLAKEPAPGFPGWVEYPPTS